MALRLEAELVPYDTAAQAESGPDEAEVRRMLATVPLARLREAGVLDVLTRIAGTIPVNVEPFEARTAAIDDAGIDDLIRMALVDQVD
jgi:hypothetical protein